MNTQIVTLFLSPIIPVLITLWWQRRKEKHDAKRNLFITLMAHRRAFPPTIEWVNALNVIDVVFADHTKVVNLWHRYYDELHKKPEQMDAQAREHAYLEMLSAMAKVLGYTRLQQTDIDKFYSPIAHGNQLEINYKTQQEFLRVLKNTSRFETTPRLPEQEPSPPLPSLEDPPRLG